MKNISKKKPFLDPPWRVGLLVALLLLIVGCGVGFYFIKSYEINVQWLQVTPNQWQFDPYLFIRQMYPIVAGIVILSLSSYFIFSSAVRRYLYYLDSGQDYRKMVALARGIDDLTNPAQISKLSGYPELQSILRSYGDNMREISLELEQRQEEISSGEFEAKISALLSGESVEREEDEEKWWSSIVNDVADYVEGSREAVADLRDKIETSRCILNQAALSQGKVIELVSRSSEDLLDIVRAIGELSTAVSEAETSPGQTAALDVTGLSKTVTEMENVLKKLSDGGRVLDEFSKENNNLALNIALMAAKGGVGDQRLAQFAEKVRSTAERFSKLSGTISSIAQSLLGNCYQLRQRVEGNGVDVATGGSGIYQTIIDVSKRIDAISRKLQQNICNLGSEFHDVQEILQDGLRNVAKAGKEAVCQKKETRAQEKRSIEEADIVNFGAGSASDAGSISSDSEDIVIDHGDLWDALRDNMSASVESDEDAIDEAPETGRESQLLAHGEITLGNDITIPSEQESGVHPATEEPLRPNVARSVEAPGEQEEPGSSEDWLEMPGHRWVKIDVEEENAGTGDKGLADTGMEVAEENEEPIYDLFELGAVEYVEERKAPEVR